MNERSRLKTSQKYLSEPFFWHRTAESSQPAVAVPLTGVETRSESSRTTSFYQRDGEITCILEHESRSTSTTCSTSEFRFNQAATTELVKVINDNTPAKAELVVWDKTYAVRPDVDIVINATSIGLYPHVDGRLDIETQSSKAGMVVADVVPSPPRTNLIMDAEANGCTIVDGLGMLVNQGVISIKYWTGIDVDPSVMRRKLEQIYGT
jgi:hypothetical protein